MRPWFVPGPIGVDLINIGPALFTRDVVSTQDNSLLLLFKSILCHRRTPAENRLWKASGSVLCFTSLSGKGVSIMVIFFFGDCCRMVAMCSNTLRGWLGRSFVC